MIQTLPTYPMRGAAKRSQCSSRVSHDLEHEGVLVSLRCLGGAELDLGVLPRTAAIRHVREAMREQLGGLAANWTLLYGADIISDSSKTLSQICGRNEHSIDLTVVRSEAPKFVWSTRTALLLCNGLAFQGTHVNYGYDWALVQPSVSSLTVRLGPMRGEGSSYFLGILPQTFIDMSWKVGLDAGICLYMSAEGHMTGTVKLPNKRHSKRNAKPVFSQANFAEGDFASVEFDRHAGVCRFGRGNPNAGVDWSKNFDVPFEGRLGVGIFALGHATVCV